MKYILLIILLVSHLFVLSQKYNFRYYGADEGLPQQSVLSILSDREGILHLGTQGGFSRFDGKKFTNLSQKDGLNSNHVTSIYQDIEGDFWLGHRYDAPTFVSGDSIKALTGGWSDSIRSSTWGITRCLDKMWFVTEKEGLFFYDINSDKVLPFKDDKLKDLTVTTLLTVDDRLYIGTNKGVFYRQDGALEKLTNSKIDNLKILSIKPDKSNKSILYFLTTNKLIKAEVSKNDLSSIEVVFSQNQTNLTSWKDFVVVDKNEFWIYSQEGAIHLKDSVSSTYTLKNGLGMNHVESMEVDREGNVWFGLFGQGLYQLLGEDFLQIDSSIGLIDDKVTGISAFKNEVWVTTEGGVSRIFYQTEKRVKIERIKNYTSRDKLIENEVFAVVNNSRGDFLLSSMNGVVYYDRGRDKFNQFSSSKYGLTTFNITVEIDDDDNIWLGSLGNGASKFRINEQGLPADVEIFNAKNGFFSDEIWKVFNDSKGRIWFGSNDQGLAKYEKGDFKYFGVEEGLTNERPGSITEDINGNIWLGTIGGGVFKYDGTSFVNYTSDDGIQADNPYFVAADDLGNIWIGSNRGVDRLNVDTEQIDFFGKSQGFKGVETNQNAFFKDNNGTMWFGTIDGVMQCFPQRIKPSKTPPLIFIEGVRIYLMKKELTEGVLLEYNENHITFDFNGIHYGSPDDVEFSFKLEGFDDVWSPVTKENAATYSNLPPGDYTFFVKAKNRSGVWSEPAEFSVRISPPFWETWWFQTFVFVALICIVFIVFRFRTRKLRKQRELLKKLVNQRTLELKEEKDKVELFNLKLSSQNELLAIKNKDITDSIRYAERIQNGMLPGDKEIAEILPQSFVLYLPRDIVSGDFYWCTKKDDITCFAAIDCTGHGVPGAFMSLIGNDLLNQVANNPELDNTGKLLATMHVKLKKYFLREGGTNVNDGMDMAICAIKPSNILEFSGAKRPLYLVRDNEVHIFKGDRYSIGESFEEDVAFTTNEISLVKGDMIYIFSDGYQDQFGGGNGKKFMVKQLRNLLIEISDKPLEKQKQILLDTFNNWKGTHEQVDDILIWGVRI
ncbi:MAG: hypothetical protein COA32_16115 [Fluviicola sp.]|nr:MAG: hypothetical protein COA32_16115 [Fluviicola sp.]